MVSEKNSFKEEKNSLTPGFSRKLIVSIALVLDKIEVMVVRACSRGRYLTRVGQEGEERGICTK